MNSHQRRKHTRKMQRDWPIGTRVNVFPWGDGTVIAFDILPRFISGHSFRIWVENDADGAVTWWRPRYLKRL